MATHNHNFSYANARLAFTALHDFVAALAEWLILETSGNMAAPGNGDYFVIQSVYARAGGHGCTVKITSSSSNGVTFAAYESWTAGSPGSPVGADLLAGNAVLDQPVSTFQWWWVLTDRSVSVLHSQSTTFFKKVHAALLDSLYPTASDDPTPIVAVLDNNGDDLSTVGVFPWRTYTPTGGNTHVAAGTLSDTSVDDLVTGFKAVPGLSKIQPQARTSTATWLLMPIAPLETLNNTGSHGQDVRGTFRDLRLSSGQLTDLDLFDPGDGTTWIQFQQWALRWADTTPAAGPSTHAAVLVDLQPHVAPTPPPNTVAPTVTNVSPASGSAVTAQTPIEFDVADDLGLLRRVFVRLKYGGLPLDEVAHDGDAFGAAYTNGTCTRNVITNGWHYKLLRDGGWPASPTVTAYAIDTSGNEV